MRAGSHRDHFVAVEESVQTDFPRPSPFNPDLVEFPVGDEPVKEGFVTGVVCDRRTAHMSGRTFLVVLDHLGSETGKLANPAPTRGDCGRTQRELTSVHNIRRARYRHTWMAFGEL